MSLLDSMPNMDQAGPDRPIQSRETQDKLQRVKKRNWVAEPGKIRDGMQAQIEKFFNGEK